MFECVYHMLVFETGFGIVSGLEEGSSSNFFFKRGSAQPGCILGGLRFQSTAIRFFKFVWCFQQQLFRKFFLRNGSN